MEEELGTIILSKSKFPYLHILEQNCFTCNLENIKKLSGEELDIHISLEHAMLVL